MYPIITSNLQNFTIINSQISELFLRSVKCQLKIPFCCKEKSGFCDRTEIWFRKAINLVARLETSEAIKEQLNWCTGPYQNQWIAKKPLWVSMLLIALSKDIDTKEKSFRTSSNVKCKTYGKWKNIAPFCWEKRVSDWPCCSLMDELTKTISEIIAKRSRLTGISSSKDTPCENVLLQYRKSKFPFTVIDFPVRSGYT